MRRAPRALLAGLLALALLAPGGVAAGQGVDELWEEYPLDERAAPAAPSQTPGASPSPTAPRGGADPGDDRGDDTSLVPLAAGGLALLALAVFVVRSRPRRREAPPPAPIRSRENGVAATRPVAETPRPQATAAAPAPSAERRAAAAAPPPEPAAAPPPRAPSRGLLPSAWDPRRRR